MGNSILIVNPNPISRQGLRRILDDGGINVVRASAAVEELADISLSVDHLVVLDVPSPAEQLASLQHLRKKNPSARVVVLAEQFDMTAMMACFSNGAQGYAVKNVPCSTLIALLHLAALGHKIMPSDLADQLKIEDFKLKSSDDGSSLDATEANLSQREHEVLCCLMAGYSNKRIGRLLAVSEATVKVHVKAILRKLNVMNRTQAAMWATARGLAAVEQCSSSSLAN